MFGLLTLVGCDGGNRDQANRLYSAGETAAAQGNHEEAVRLLTEAVELYPAGFIHFERAKSYAALGKDDAASQDIEAARADGVADSECLRLRAEMRKPVEQRFKLPPRPQPTVK
jgi:tetratricopeptide (TPR) repeat protein